MGKRNRKRTRKAEALVLEEISVIEHSHKEMNGAICCVQDDGLESGSCKKSREDYEATGDISVDFPEDVELDVGTESTEGISLIHVHEDQESLLDANLSNDSDPKHSDATIDSHSDSAIIKSEIFDPAYDMHQYLATGAAEYDLGLLNGIDPLHTFNMKHELLEDGLLNSTAKPEQQQQQQLTVGGLTPQAPLSLMSLPANCLSTAVSVSLPNVCLGSSSFADSLTTSSHSQNIGAINNAVLASPVLLPSGTPLNSAFAQIAKIEPGADGKGYILHLNIPAVAGGHIAVTADGLMGTEPRLLMPNNGQLPESTAAVDVVNHEDIGGLRSGVTVSQVDCSTASLSPTTDGEDIDPIGDSPQPDVDGIIEEEICDLQPGQDNLDSANIEEASASSMEEYVGSASSDDGSVNEENYKKGTESSGWVSSGGSGSGSTAASYEDPVDVDRFVICSDGPMECVLCSFKTDSYSAFKSHIICSHPCWRITKKLSKNRLLVEKSVRMNVSITQPNLAAVQSQLKKALAEKEFKQQQQQQQSNKSLKSNSQSTRRKQLIERNKRLFKCSTCFRLFVFEGSIVNHLLDHHLVKKPYDYIQVSNDHGKSFGLIHRCPHKNCFVSCASLEELEKHKNESHAQFVFRCQICGFTAYTTRAVKEHASVIHYQVLKSGLND